MKEADDQDLQAKLGRQRRKRNKSGYRFNCNCQALKTSLTNHLLVLYFKCKERIYKSTHFNLGFIGMICKLIIGITYSR